MGPFSFPAVAREILLAVDIPLDTEQEVLDAWVTEGRLFCACGSTGAEITSDRCKFKKLGTFFSESTGWMKLVSLASRLKGHVPRWTSHLTNLLLPPRTGATRHASYLALPRAYRAHEV